MNKNYRKKGKISIGSVIAKVFCVIQLTFSLVAIVIFWSVNFLPQMMMYILVMALLALFGISFFLSFTKKRWYLLGIIISILLSIGLAMSSFYINRIGQAMKKITGATYKTDKMVVVVRSNDHAKNLIDTKGYTYGIQTAQDTNNTRLMIEDIEKSLGESIEPKEYKSLKEEMNGLLSGEIDAAIYNDGYSGVLKELIPAYEQKVKVVYHYGIQVAVDTESIKEPENEEEPFNVYISGIDVSGDISTNSRSDVNLIMTVNPKTKQILLTNTPRDYYVAFPDITGGQKDKLTHSGIYGVDVSMKTLEELYGIDIHYYVRVNFTSLITIVDALGGVDVYSEYAFTSSYKGYQFHEGMNHMNGDEALGFARERNSFERGDNQRGKNQQAILAGIIQKASTPAVLTGFSGLISAIGSNVQTNMSNQRMSELAQKQIADGRGWVVKFASATGTGSEGACFSSGDQQLYVMIPDASSVGEVSKKIKSILKE